MFMKNFLSTNICLTLVTIQKIQSFLMRLIKKVIGKMKNVQEGKMIDGFIELKSKMYSIKNIDVKETNTEKAVNIAIEFNEFKDIFFNKKILRHKMRRI